MARAIGIDLPATLRSARARVHVYNAPFEKKGVSPLWQDGAFSLAICGTDARRAVAKDDNRVNAQVTPADGRVRVIVALAHGKVTAAFLVGTVMSARDYCTFGLSGAALVPKRPKRPRAPSG
eukprot:7789271-Pyramimonas_sp.AAC.1